MTGIYYVEAADWLRSVGLTVVEVKGWQTRARSSGGFPSPTGALGVQWHHTASQTTPTNDTNWQYFTSSVRPIGNMLITRTGEVWIGAAGGANTAGTGGPLTLSRGTIPASGANSRTWAIEVANSGVGEPWSQACIDAYFKASNELNRRFGNKPTDCFTHYSWTPGRKIDPAKASAVQGPWQPRALNSSGTWNLDDVRAECARRAGVTPPPKPIPPPPGGTYTVVAGDSWYAIARKLGCTVNALVAANPPKTINTVLHPGDTLNVPGTTPPPTQDWVKIGADASTPPGSPTLRKGVTHSNVTWLQSVLCSMPKLPADGGKSIYDPAYVDKDPTSQAFGDRSHAAVAYWQSKNQDTTGKPLAADGIYGNTTAAAMAKVRGK